PLGVAAFCGDTGKPGCGEQDASPVTEAYGELEAADRQIFGAIEISAFALELGGTGELSALPPGPANLVGDRGALERELERARKIALFLVLDRQVPEHLGLTTREAQPPKRTE